MFKKIIYLLLIIVGIGFLILLWQYFDFYNFKPEQEILLSEQNEKNNLNPQLKKTIEDYLVTLDDLAWQTEDETSNICVFENLDSDNELFPLSLWVYCVEYRIDESGEIEKFSGVSLPLLLDYPNELSFYDLEKFTFKIPRDGAFYGADIREIFSENIQEKILSHNSVEILETKLDEKIKAKNISEE
ncbi:MAG: hypothetical protein V1851_01150 [Patescibacteria group bacterium]